MFAKPPGMPMGAPPMPGGSGMPHPGGGTGPATAPQPMAGAASSGITGVKTALKALQEALPGLPMGGELHSAVLKAVTELSKHMDQGGGGDQGDVVQKLAMLARQAQAQPNKDAMMRAFPQQPGAGGGAPAPGPSPSPMAA